MQVLGTSSRSCVSQAPTCWSRAPSSDAVAQSEIAWSSCACTVSSALEAVCQWMSAPAAMSARVRSPTRPVAFEEGRRPKSLARGRQRQEQQSTASVVRRPRARSTMGPVLHLSTKRCQASWEASGEGNSGPSASKSCTHQVAFHGSRNGPGGVGSASSSDSTSCASPPTLQPSAQDQGPRPTLATNGTDMLRARWATRRQAGWQWHGRAPRRLSPGG
mmetsp:Transcript_91133/g.283480  ORF Transcript_91133/g.283480 Transcript_91133/m.283480 type:complete len:218 (-) Transcript_91133:22-675(-)